MKSELYTWNVRGFFTVSLESEPCRWLIRTFHFSESSSSQRSGEPYPKALVVESIARQRQELLNDSLSGGIMGGYLEAGFPFYFVNRRMLDDYYIGDAMKLQQVLVSILGNAIKFTGEGGKVTFSASQHSKSKNGAVLRFLINDTGVGMSAQFLPHIFEPFSQEYTGTTALYGGTGLGLAISKNIVDLMGGRITVRSIKGIGTEFTVDVKLGITEEELLRHQ